jgi:hypothetical protein
MALTAWIAADRLQSRGDVVDPANQDEAFGRPHLPERVRNPDYSRGPIPKEMYVPALY